MSKPYIGISESQSAANADALARRERTYTTPHETTVRLRWGGYREPRDLHEAVDLVRRAHADEVPDKLHDGPDAIGDDGTPRMTSRAMGYIFGDPRADDAAWDPETGQRDLSGWHFTPFRAELARLEHGAESERKRAAIVSHVSIGSMGAQRAAVEEGVPHWCAKIVALDVLCSFLRGMSDLSIHAPRVQESDQGVA